jgi:Mrp family chromosome partitioning ATPase
MNFRSAAIGFIAVFGGFGLYAFVSPPTFESTAMVEVLQSKVPTRIEPLDAVLAFETSVLDATFLERLRAEYAFSTSSEARASVDVTTSDSRSYVIQCRAGDGSRAQKICDVVAARAHERAAHLVSLLRQPQSDDHERVLASEALASFARRTPEILTPTPSSSVAAQTALEWRRLVGEVTKPPAERPSPEGPPPAVRVIQAATLPGYPIEPNRIVALWLGFAFGLLFALVLGVGGRRAPRATTSDDPEVLVHGVEWSELRDQLVPNAPEAPTEPAALDSGFVTARTVSASSLAAARVPNIPVPEGGAPAPSGETTQGSQARTLVGMAVPASLTPAGGLTPIPASDGAYRFADVESITSSLEQRVSTSTAILGSPVAPQVAPSSDASPRYSSVPPPQPSSSFPPPRASSSGPPPLSPPTSSRPPMEPTGARYSYVSSSPPKATGVSVVEPSSESKSHPDLRPEACKPLRRELYAFGVERCFVIGVSSVLEARERKSRFATELALSLAETGHARVLLLDVDSARGSAPAMLLGLEMRKHRSLSEQLEHHVALGVERPWEVIGVAKALHVLAGAGLPFEAPSALAFERCMQVLRSNYDFIVVHGPSLSDEAACELLAPNVDGVLAISFDSDPSVRRALGPFLTKRLARVVLCSRDVP